MDDDDGLAACGRECGNCVGGRTEGGAQDGAARLPACTPSWGPVSWCPTYPPRSEKLPHDTPLLAGTMLLRRGLPCTLKITGTSLDSQPALGLYVSLQCRMSRVLYAQFPSWRSYT